MNKDSLGDRMKSYENITRTYLPRRMPVIIRVDGKAFHTFTKGFCKPFDCLLMRTMEATAQELCRKIEGVKLAYTQSDEISLLITNDDTWETQPWFGNNLQKMVSVAASIATWIFNKVFWRELNNYDHTIPFGAGKDSEEHKLLEAYCQACMKGALFDARAFVLPKDEVCNYFIWRQQDAIRNSIQAMGQANFSHKELMNKSCEDIKQMLIEKNIEWETYPKACQRGISVVKKPIKIRAESNPSMEIIRNHWSSDEDIPLFWEDRDYIDCFLRKEN